MRDPKATPPSDGIGFDRRSILIGGAGLAGLGAAGLGASFLYNSPARLVEQIVRSHLPGLHIDDEEMVQFVADFIAADIHTTRTERLGLRLLAPFVNMPPFRWLMPGFVSRGYENFERRVMNEFMMGSDFFDTYAVGNPKVTYTGLYAVYEAPCAGPLPRFPQEPDPA